MAPAPPPLQPPAQLPGQLQHAVHTALGDLQAMRLLYPQQCAAAERQGESLRDEAERWVGGWWVGGWVGGWAAGQCSIAAHLEHPSHG